MLDEKKILDAERIRSIATKVATANLSSQSFTTVTSGSTTDSTGNEALQITIVIKPEVRVTGDAALKTLVEMQDLLLREGEERFPIIELLRRTRPVTFRRSTSADIGARSSLLQAGSST